MSMVIPEFPQKQMSKIIWFVLCMEVSNSCSGMITVQGGPRIQLEVEIWGRYK